MSAPKWTPGPWKVGMYLGSLRSFVIHMDVGDKGRGMDIAFTSADFCNDETIANARLIAAAPELYRIAQELLDEYEGAGYCASSRFVDECRAILAKARGES